MKKIYNINMNTIFLSNTAFTTPSSIDGMIVNYFNNLGIYGNLILVFLSLLIATFYGGLIGYQREISGHPAGFRTHILISLGGALIMIISIYGVGGEMTRDPMRLAAAGITGISFLGAGTIVKNGVSVKGLTTAGTIWVTMALGMCSGAGYFVTGLFTTIITLLCLISFQKFEEWTSKKITNIILIVDENNACLSKLITLLNKYNLKYQPFDTSNIELNNRKVLRISFTCKHKKDSKIDNFVNELNELIKPISIKVNK